MRVIAGTWRGKKLGTPEGDNTRPTSDRAKETLFNVLSSYFLKHEVRWADVTFADVFAGSGGIGIEALSRGAKEVVLIENDRKALECIRQNIAGLPHITVLATDACRSPKREKPVSVLFMDAPYGKGLWQAAFISLENAGWIDDRTLVIIETDARQKEGLPKGWELLQERSAGRNVFLLAEKQKEE